MLELKLDDKIVEELENIANNEGKSVEKLVNDILYDCLENGEQI